MQCMNTALETEATYAAELRGEVGVLEQCQRIISLEQEPVDVTLLRSFAEDVVLHFCSKECASNALDAMIG